MARGAPSERPDAPRRTPQNPAGSDKTPVKSLRPRAWICTTQHDSIGRVSSPTGSRVAELEAALAREERISEALREVGSALGATLDLDDLLELILDKLTQILDADRATLYLLDEASNELVSRIVVGGEVRSIRVKVGHGIAGTVAQTGKPLRVKDAYADERFEREWDQLTGYETKHMLVVPLKNHLGRTIGVIQVLNKKDAEEFTNEDEAILAALSTQAAVAIVNSRLFLSLIQKNKQLLDATDQLERSVQDLKLLFNLERSMGHATSIEELAVAALGEAAESCEASGAALLLSEQETGDLVEYVVSAESPKDVVRLGVKAGEGFLGASMSEAESIKLRKAREDPRWNDNVEAKYPFEVESLIVTPLEGEGDAPIGAMALFSKRGGRDFSDEDASLLRLVSANVSTSVRLFRANEARERGERLEAIGRLLSGIIHDFKTPMTVISGYVQLMESAEEAPKRAEYTEEILKQFDVLTSMQREVLEFARGEKNVFMRKVYIQKFFGDISRQLGHEIDGRAIELEFDVDTKLVARFDEQRLARAIHNLARNAVEAMAERGGRLTIHASKDGGDLVIRVSDTGPGIPAEVEGRLFQSFVTAGKKGGTGLGLAIVKKIVDEHEGTIQVLSKKRGVTFELRLPQPEDGRKGTASSRPRASSKAAGSAAAKTSG